MKGFLKFNILSIYLVFRHKNILQLSRLWFILLMENYYWFVCITLFVTHEMLFVYLFFLWCSTFARQG